MFQTAAEPRRLPKSEATIGTILSAAARLFLTKSYADVTMNQIARAGRLTKGALYHHFASKEQLYLAMMHAHLGELEVRFATAMGGGSNCRDCLERLTAAFFELPARKRDLMKLVRRDVNIFREPARSGLIRAYQRCLPEQVERVIREGIHAGQLVAGDPRLLAWQFVACVEVVLGRYADRILASPEAKLAHTMRLFFHGIAPGGGAGR